MIVREPVARDGARVRIDWLAPGEGGRASGPPRVARYWANVWFGERAAELLVFEPAREGVYASAVFDLEGVEAPGVLADLRLLEPALAAECRRHGPCFAVMEGPRVVGRGRVIDWWV